jgi:hypothetical protein
VTAADWGILVPSIAALLGAVTALIKSRTVRNQLQAHKQQDHGPKL